MLNLKNTLNFINSIFIEAGKELLLIQNKAKIVQKKQLLDYATSADIKIEKFLTREILKKFPEHQIRGEEHGLMGKKSDYLWFVDPLDGTKEYFRQIPNYNISICLFYQNKVVLSVVYIPYSCQFFSATINNGAFLNNKKITVNKESNLKNSYVFVYPPTKRSKIDLLSKGNLSTIFYKLSLLSEKAYRLRFDQNQNTTLCYLSFGALSSYINMSNRTKCIHDLTPGMFIAKMAGAKITDLKGNMIDITNPNQLYVTSNGLIHDKLVDLIN